MKKLRRMILPLMVVVMLALLAAITSVQASTNIVANPGFENGEGGWPWPWWDGGGWSWEDQVAHSGTRSLKVTCSDPADYQLTGQGIPVVPGEFYNVSAWVKTADVAGAGASICLEWYKDGQYYGGAYDFRQISGTEDWQLVSVPRVLVPGDATSCIVYLCLARGSTGAAWFDDVSVEKWVAPVLSSFVLRPNYAGKILPVSPNPEIEVEISLNPEEHGLALDQLSVVSTLQNPAGETVIEDRHDSLASNKFAVGMSIPPGTPAGNYNLVVRLYNRSGEMLAENTYSLDKLSNERFSALTSYIDPYNRFVLNGEPFFPIGIYMGHDYRWDYSQIDEIAAGPIDTIMNYITNVGTGDQIAAYLDYLQSKNLKLIYSLAEYVGDPAADLNIITQKVSTYKDHPAIISWYMNDEEGLTCLPELEANYQRVRQLDENHPVWTVHYRKDCLLGEVHTTDILGVDPYPVPHRPITLVSEMADWAAEAGRGYRPLWLVSQIFDPSNYGDPGGRIPTRDEMRAMTYLALNHGANGLVYYSYFDIRLKDYYPSHWANVKAIASEVASLKPALLSIDPVDASASSSNSSLDCRLIKDGSECYLLAVNTLNGAISGASFTVSGTGDLSLIDVLFENGRQVPLVSSSFTDDFGPYQVHVYRWQRATLTLSNVNVSDISASGATISWTTNNPATSKVSYGYSPDALTQAAEDSALVTSHALALTGLQDGKTVYYQAFSSDSAGNHASSGVNQFETPDGTPPVISGTTASDISSSGAGILWTTNEPGNSRVLYGYSPDALTNSSQDEALVFQHSIQITGLPANTTVYYRVLSADAAGNTASSGIASFATLPGAIINLSAPANGAIISSKQTPTFTWTSTGYGQFKVQYSGGSDFPAGTVLTLPAKWSTGTSFTPNKSQWTTIKKKAVGGRIYWRVMGQNGGSTGYSDVRSFLLN
ncbi:MAG: fibronectin type III domain-containing protein [Pseudomonadota bacterium]